MELTITLGKLTRTFHVDEDDIYNNDWNATLADMLDTIEKAKLKIAGIDFGHALDTLDNLKI